jgi:signal transduction histidine kinase
MATNNDSVPSPTSTAPAVSIPGGPPPLEQILARVLRHEVADLLQTVYSAVAILQDRFPGDGLEHQLLGFLKGRAETCRLELDAAVDLVCPLSLRWSPVDLTVLTASLLPPLRVQFPDRQIEWTTPESLSIETDANRLSLLLQLLLRSACHLAVRRVEVNLSGRPSGVVWSIRRDGPALTDEQRSWLERPFTTTRAAMLGLGLALARRLVGLHGGEILVENLEGGGVVVNLGLPLKPPAGHP